MDKIDYKKTEKHLYLPKNLAIVEVPEMVFFAVDGRGDPNTSPDYREAMELLYGLSFTVKMSRMGGEEPAGYFEYVVPPLEGFWWQEGRKGIDYAHKEDFVFISLIRLPDFVTKDDFAWAVAEAAAKKKIDVSKVEYLSYNEGVCVQCMHIGHYDEEPQTVAKMHAWMHEQGYGLDLSSERFHHEIYLSDARKTSPEKMKTVIRHPVKKL